MEYAPVVPDVAKRSRQMECQAQLDPLAEFPGLFTCKLNGSPAIGCVFRNGAVMVMPDFVERGVLQTLFVNMRIVDEANHVTEIKWEWQVTRRPQHDPPRPVVPGS